MNESNAFDFLLSVSEESFHVSFFLCPTLLLIDSFGKVVASS